MTSAIALAWALGALLGPSSVGFGADDAVAVESGPGTSTATAADLEPPSVPTLSWDILGGGVPDGGGLVSARIGFSRLGELAFELPVMERLAVGAAFGLDFGEWTPEGAGEDLALAFGLTGRLGLLRDAEWSLGATAGLGARVRLGGDEGWDLVIPLAARALYAVDARLLIGGAVDVPIRLGFPERGSAFLALPITVGAAGELHLLPTLALTAVVGIGPALDTRRVEAAFRATVGVAHRF